MYSVLFNKYGVCGNDLWLMGTSKMLNNLFFVCFLSQSRPESLSTGKAGLERPGPRSLPRHTMPRHAGPAGGHINCYINSLLLTVIGRKASLPQ